MNLFDPRSILFVPANKLNKIEKVAASGPDIIMIDLEDSINPDQKGMMRDELTKFFSTEHNLSSSIGVRINSMRTLDGIMDLLSISNMMYLPDVLMIPKVKHSSEIDLLIDLLSDIGISIPLIPLAETLEFWDDIDHILLNDLVTCVAFGGIDLAAELGSDTSWDTLLMYRVMLLRSARKNGKGCVDMPWFALHDTEGLESETLKVKSLGFDGRIAIHPDQVNVIHKAFHPTEEEIREAQGIVQSAEDSNAGVSVFNGKVVERPVLASAYKVLVRAERYQ